MNYVFFHFCLINPLLTHTLEKNDKCESMYYKTVFEVMAFLTISSLLSSACLYLHLRLRD